MPEITYHQPVDETAIYKEVFKNNDIKVKTELSDDQIETLNKLTTMHYIFGNPLLASNINSFMEFQLSRNRKSRLEFIDGLKSKQRDGLGDSGVLNKLMG